MSECWETDMLRPYAVIDMDGIAVEAAYAICCPFGWFGAYKIHFLRH